MNRYFRLMLLILPYSFGHAMDTDQDDGDFNLQAYRQQMASTYHARPPSPIDTYADEIEAMMENRYEVQKMNLPVSQLVSYIASILGVQEDELERELKNQTVKLNSVLGYQEGLIRANVETLLLHTKNSIYSKERLSDANLIEKYKRLISPYFLSNHTGCGEDLKNEIYEILATIAINHKIKKYDKKGLSENITDEKIEKQYKKKISSILYYLDGYLTRELLTCSSLQLKILTDENIKDYKENPIVQKFLIKNIINHEFKPDTLETWALKKQHLFMLEFALKSIMAEYDRPEDFGLMQMELKECLLEPLVSFYLSSHDLLYQDYEAHLAAPLDVHGSSQLFLNYMTLLNDLHSECKKNHDELFNERTAIRYGSLNAKHGQTLTQLFGQQVQKLKTLFKATIEKKDDLHEIEKENATFLMTTQNHWEKVKSSYPASPTNKEGLHVIDNMYNQTINYYFNLLLDNFEIRYENQRNSLTQALTYFGVRTSQTREFLNRIVELYKKTQGFLFDESKPYAKDIKARLKALEEKMLKIDNDGVNKSLNTVTEKLSALNPFSYWSSSSKYN